MFFTERAAPHEIYETLIITVWNHGEFRTAQRGAMLVNKDVVRDCFWPSTLAVEVNKGTDVACFEESLGSIGVGIMLGSSERASGERYERCSSGVVSSGAAWVWTAVQLPETVRGWKE